MRRLVLAGVFLFACPIALAQHAHATAASGRVSPCTKNNYMPNAANPDFKPAALRDDLQKVTWTVSHADTAEGKDAQKYFSQGMTEYYGFNYEAALRNFRTAAMKDGQMPMAWWGIALAAGPNINIGMDDGCREVAFRAIGYANALSSDRQELSGDQWPVETGLITALAFRYTAPLTETVAYAVAMRQVWERAKSDWKHSPQDVRKKHDAANVGALYAESLIDMRPWGLFDAAYREALDTPTILDVLLEAMKPEPNADVSTCISPATVVSTCPDRDAIGAVHFYIHAIEASSVPKLGEKSANVLRDAKTGAGHLVHMPSHIYFLTGDYLSSMQSNNDAVCTDRTQYGQPCGGSYDKYSKDVNCPQLYYGHYLSHNLFFRTVSAAFAGQRTLAMNWASQTRDHASRFVANEPGLQRYMTAPLMMMVMNRNWDAILQEPITEKKLIEDCDRLMSPFAGDGCHIYRAMWHWARGMAYAADGYDGKVTYAHEANLRFARDQYDLMAVQMREIVPPTPTGWGNNTAAAVLAIAQSTLQARFTWAGGWCRYCTTGLGCAVPHYPEMAYGPELKDQVLCDVSYCKEVRNMCDDATEQAIEHLKLAVTHEDALVYDEPPQWFPAARESLGGAYLRAAQGGPLDKAEALYELARKTFETELGYEKNHLGHPKSGRALYGRLRALQGLMNIAKGGPKFDNNKAEFEKTKAEFCEAWQNADYQMTDDDLWPPMKNPSRKDDSDKITCELKPQPPPKSCP